MDHLKMSMSLFIVGRVALHFSYMCCLPHYTAFQCSLIHSTLSSFHNKVFGSTCVLHTFIVNCDAVQPSREEEWL